MKAQTAFGYKNYTAFCSDLRATISKKKDNSFNIIIVDNIKYKKLIPEPNDLIFYGENLESVELLAEIS